MNKINTILVPTDFSDTASSAFKFAIQYASLCQANIKLLHVIIPNAGTMDVPIMAASYIKERMEIAQEVSKTFTESNLAAVSTAQHLDHIPAVNATLKIGVPSTVIIQVAKAEAIDLIIMGTQGEHHLLDRIFGSVTNSVLGNTTTPVLVIPEGYVMNNITSIAYASNLSKSDPYYIWKAGRLLNVFHPIVRIVHVDTDSATEDAIDFDELEAFLAGHLVALQQTFHTLKGEHLSKELEDLVNNVGVDLLVMFKPKRGLFNRIFHKSQTKLMSLHTKVPLLILN